MNRFISILLFVSFFCIIAKEKDSIPEFYTGEILILPKQNQNLLNSSQSEIKISDLSSSRYLTADKQINYISGMLVQKNSKNESFIKMRGYDQRQIGIFYDGVPLSNQFDGLVDIGNFSLGAISKISINKGTTSTLYGANNLAGSINIITENIYAQNSMMGEALIGNASQIYSAKINQNIDKFFLTASFTEQNSKNLNASADNKTSDISNSSFNNRNAFVKLAYKNNPNSIFSLSANYFDNSKDIPMNSETTKPRFWKMPSWDMLILNLTHYNYVTNFMTIRGNVFLNNNSNVLNSYDDATFSSQNAKSSFTSLQKDEIYGANFIVEIDNGLIDLSKISISFRQDKHSEQGNIGLDWRSYESRISTVGYEQSFSYSGFGALAGINYDYLEPLYADGKNLRDSESSINYQIGFNYIFSDLRLFANYSHKSRFPTLKEFYAEILGSNVANPDLTSENGRNAEFGLNYNILQNLNIKASYYQNAIENLIDINFLPENKRQFVNIGEAVFSGIETELNYKYDNYAAYLSLNYLNSENKSKNATTTILTLRPELTLMVSFTAKFEFGTELQIEFIHYSKQYAYNSDKKENYLLPDYSLLNLSINQQIIDNISFTCSLNNIFDILYFADWGFPQQGFNFQAGVRVNY